MSSTETVKVNTHPVHTGPFTPTPADMEDIYFGIAVCHVGEDGDLLALGHHEPRRVLAAFNRHARTFVGLVNLTNDRSTKAADVLTDIKPKWAFFRLPDPTQGEDRDCPWWADWSDEEHPGWTPVTILRMN